MPLADDTSAPTKGIKKPRKPRRPYSASYSHLPTEDTPNINPTADISAGRVRQAPSAYLGQHPNGNYMGPVQQGRPYRPIPSNVNGLASPVGTPDTPSDTNAVSAALDYMKSIMRSRSQGEFTQNNFPSPSVSNIDPPRSNAIQSTQDNYSPYSNYAEGLQGAPYNNYAEQLAKSGAYDAMNVDSPANPDREPSQVLTEKEILRKLSRRGGFGIFNPRGPIPGFNYEADNPSFGPRTHPVHGRSSNHTGEDYSSALGTPIVAPVGGKVSRATPDGGAYGNQVILDHGQGEQTMYGHLANMVVEPGQKVKKGDIIGYVGSTGLSTGPHLHWETWKDGQVMDPNTIWDREVPQEIIDAAMSRFSGQGGPSQPFQPGQGVSGAAQSTPAPPQTPNNNELAQNPRLNALMQAIREQESAGDYGVQNGIGAMGAYQIMPSNIEGSAGWDMEALGQNITGAQFLNSPELQNKIAKFKLRNYFKTFGPAGAAKAWYAGPGNADLNSDAPQYGGPSVNDYADSVLELMKKYM